MYPTIAKQFQPTLGLVGVSNFLFPNDAAMKNLAYGYDFTCERLEGTYTNDYPSRSVFKLNKLAPLRS